MMTSQLWDAACKLIQKEQGAHRLPLQPLIRRWHSLPALAKGNAQKNLQKILFLSENPAFSASFCPSGDEGGLKSYRQLSCTRGCCKCNAATTQMQLQERE